MTNSEPSRSDKIGAIKIPFGQLPKCVRETAERIRYFTAIRFREEPRVNPFPNCLQQHRSYFCCSNFHLLKFGTEHPYKRICVTQ